MFKYMKDEEWDILIPVILILIICVFVLNHYAEENAAEKTSPDVGVMFSDREFGIAPLRILWAVTGQMRKMDIEKKYRMM